MSDLQQILFFFIGRLIDRFIYLIDWLIDWSGGTGKKGKVDAGEAASLDIKLKNFFEEHWFQNIQTISSYNLNNKFCTFLWTKTKKKLLLKLVNLLNEKKIFKNITLNPRTF